MNTFNPPQGQFTLNRYPTQENETLRAWDAADEYILLHLDEHDLLNNDQSILIVNDAFGALSTTLSSHKPRTITDSFIAQQSIVENLTLNNIDEKEVTIKNTLQSLDTTYDVVIIKIPKSLAMLEDELFRIRPHCHEKTIILAAAMSKHIHSSTLKLFERIIGSTKTSLARKKARLVHCEYNKDLEPGISPYPSQYKLDITDEKYSNHANVFSREKLDIGSRFMLQYIPQSNQYTRIVDLACGNGVLGIAVAKSNPMANITFVDESHMAIESAKSNVKQLLDNAYQHDFKVTDCLQGIEDDSIDLIINNPPFHQNHVVGDFIAWQMFVEAKQKLKTGGELIIVGNRHLGYHVKLKKLFGKCEMISNNDKFVILKVVK